MRYLVGCVCALTLLASPLSALAQESDSLVLSPGTLEVAEQSEVQSRLAELEAVYQRANVRKPRAGVAVSAIVITGGVAMLVAGVSARSGFGTPTENSTRVGGALLGAGTVTLAAGIGGLAFSGVRLKRAKRERRSIEPEIERLRSTLDWDAQ